MPKTIKALLLDMDGVLYHGEQAIDGAVEFMRAVAQLPHAFITNNPILPAHAIADKLEQLGFQRPQTSQIITSAHATAQYLREQKPGFRFFAVGATGLHEALAQQGGIADSAKADFVVVGEGAGIDYAQIARGIALIQKHGARLICTNPDHSVDATVNGEHCVLPGGGALVAPFAIAAEVEPVFIGKPHPLLYEMALQTLHVEAGDCLMIGDRPDTDIAGAAALGMQTALVRTGRFAPGAAYPDNLAKPSWDVENLAHLLALLALPPAR